jgi:DtxR family transcriptional regulator, Mn-dependent transcriptional regulator
MTAHPYLLTESDSVQDFLKAVYTLCTDNPRVSTGTLAETLTVAPASTTEMARRLHDAGLVDYQKHRGVALTEAGKQLALQTIRRHRLIELYLAENLDYELYEVHDEAEQLEHAVSERFVEALAQALGDPEVDPHGDPIPTPEGVVKARPLTLLAELTVGKKGTVCQVSDQSADVLRYLSDIGLLPSATVQVMQRAPLGDILTIKVDGGAKRAISSELAQKILVTVGLHESGMQL